MLQKDYFTEVHGAVYIPCRAYNAFQLWRDYTEEVTERDLGYAQKININAIRVWLSYEFWKENRAVFAERFENMLQIASGKGIRIMPSMFECCGREPTKENIEDTEQFTATAVRSPGTEITNDKNRWTEPFEFVEWILDNYKNDQRLLALEVTNEPKYVEDHLLAMEMARKIKVAGGSVPVTMGGQELLDNLPYVDIIDIFQMHENFPLSEEKLKVTFDRIKMVETIMEKPVWVTEWQRFRTGLSSGFSGSMVDKSQVRPNHTPMAEFFHRRNVCTFVWSLMLKPAYLTGPRLNGTFSGMFHEDGAVYSLEDARAVSGNYELKLHERRSFPECFDLVAKLSE